MHCMSVHKLESICFSSSTCKLKWDSWSLWRLSSPRRGAQSRRRAGRTWGSLLGTVSQTGWEGKWRLVPQEHLKITPSVQNPRWVFTSKEAVESVENLARVSRNLDIRLKITHFHKRDFRIIISYSIPFESNCINFKAREWANFANVKILERTR